MRDFFTENFGLKMFSLLLAVLLEVYFYSPDNSVTASLTANVEIRNLPSKSMIVSPPGGEKGLFARVTVRGPSPLVAQVRDTIQRFSIELPNDVPASYVAFLNGAQLRLPSGVSVIDVEPPRIEFQFEPVKETDLLVIVDKAGEPAPGYRLDALKVFPDLVLARGPASELEGLRVIQTQKVDISNLRSSQRFEVALVDKGKLTSLAVNVVTVEAVISPIMADKTLEHVPVKVIAPPGFAATVEPSSVSAVISGPSDALGSISQSQLELSADGRNLEEGKHELNLTAVMPQGVNLVRTEPGKVILQMVKKNG